VLGAKEKRLDGGERKTYTKFYLHIIGPNNRKKREKEGNWGRDVEDIRVK